MGTLSLHVLTPATIVGLVWLSGGSIRRHGERIEATFPGGAPSPDYGESMRRAWEAAALLKRELLSFLDLPTDRQRAIAESALLREGLFLPVPPPCPFFIGHAADACCRRCGASNVEHYPRGAP
ncbi:MAG: hypothetical protein ACYDHD_04700 [Vulcanimicrobiaceae bacterium]